MRDLNYHEITAISGGEFTDLEISLSSGFAGTAIGGIAGGVLAMGNAVGDYAFIINGIGAMCGAVFGATLGCGIGLLVGSAYIMSR